MIHDCGWTFRRLLPVVVLLGCGTPAAPSMVIDAGLRAPVTATSAPDATWAGISANTGFYTGSSYVADVNAHLLDLGKGLVRMGMDRVGGSAVGAGFTFSTRDAVVASHRAAGLAIHSVVSFRTHVSHGTSTAAWQTNWRHFVGGVFRHYAGQVGYYIIDNEPELNGITDAGFAVAMTRIAWDTAQAVGGIQIESPPTASPGKTFLQAMITAGVTRYADYLGVHAYGGEINDASSANLGKPYAWMIASGYPVRPIADSENGISTAWAPAGVDGRTWQARFFRANWIAHKRYGYASDILYSFNSTAGPSFDIATGNPTLAPQQPTYDAVKTAYRASGLLNPGFESANDRELGWAITFPIDQATPAEWSRAAFVTGDAAHAHTGTGYLRFDTGESTAGNIVRRVVDGLTPGTPYTLAAWVRVVGGGTARVKALGFSKLNGAAQASSASGTVGGWHQMRVAFTPTNTWVVVNLEGTGTGIAGQVMYWDDVSLTT